MAVLDNRKNVPAKDEPEAKAEESAPMAKFFPTEEDGSPRGDPLVVKDFGVAIGDYLRAVRGYQIAHNPDQNLEEQSKAYNAYTDELDKQRQAAIEAAETAENVKKFEAEQAAKKPAFEEEVDHKEQEEEKAIEDLTSTAKTVWEWTQEGLTAEQVEDGAAKAAKKSAEAAAATAKYIAEKGGEPGRAALDATRNVSNSAANQAAKLPYIGGILSQLLRAPATAVNVVDLAQVQLKGEIRHPRAHQHEAATKLNIERMKMIERFDMLKDLNPFVTNLKTGVKNLPAAMALFASMYTILEKEDPESAKKMAPEINHFVKVSSHLNRSFFEGYALPSKISEYLLSTILRIPIPEGLHLSLGKHSLPKLFPKISLLTAALHALGQLELGRRKLAAGANPEEVRNTLKETKVGAAAANYNLSALTFLYGDDGKGPLNQTEHNILGLFAEWLGKTTGERSEYQDIADAYRIAAADGTVLGTHRQIYKEPLENMLVGKLQSRLRQLEFNHDTAGFFKRVFEMLGSVGRANRPYRDLRTLLEPTVSAGESREALDREFASKISSIHELIKQNIDSPHALVEQFQSENPDHPMVTPQSIAYLKRLLDAVYGPQEPDLEKPQA